MELFPSAPVLVPFRAKINEAPTFTVPLSFAVPRQSHPFIPIHFRSLINGTWPDRNFVSNGQTKKSLWNRVARTASTRGTRRRRAPSVPQRNRPFSFELSSTINDAEFRAGTLTRSRRVTRNQCERGSSRWSEIGPRKGGGVFKLGRNVSAGLIMATREATRPPSRQSWWVIPSGRRRHQ